MEKSSQSSFLKSLALAFGDGLLFGVAMKLAQGSSKTREDEMTDLGPLAERLRRVEDHTQIDKDALVKFGEGQDGRVLEKVIVALEARLTEHVGQVDRRLAEIDAQVALDLKAVDTHTAAQTNAVEKAIQQIEAQVRDYVAAAQQSSAEQISGVDRKLSALQEALPAKFREIVEAVRQSMEARVTLELTELENRVSSRGVAPEQLRELQGNLRGEVEALSGRLFTEMRDLAEHQQSQSAPLQQALQQLETKLTTLREELPPKIRQIVEAVEASMDARISAGDQQAGRRWKLPWTRGSPPATSRRLAGWPVWSTHWLRCARRCPARAASSRRSTRICGATPNKSARWTRSWPYCRKSYRPRSRPSWTPCGSPWMPAWPSSCRVSRNVTARKSSRQRLASARRRSSSASGWAPNPKRPLWSRAWRSCRRTWPPWTPGWKRAAAKWRITWPASNSMLPRSPPVWPRNWNRCRRSIAPRSSNSKPGCARNGRRRTFPPKSIRRSLGCGSPWRPNSPRKSRIWKPAHRTALPTWRRPCSMRLFWKPASKRWNRSCNRARRRPSIGPSSAFGRPSRAACNSAKRTRRRR